MARRTINREPQRLIGFCDKRCALGPTLLGDRYDAAHAVFEAGGTERSIHERLAAVAIPVSLSAVSRHRRNHLRPSQGEADQVPIEDATPPGTLDLIDAIISAGWRGRRHWRPSLNDTLRAAQMKIDALGADSFDPMLAAMSAALDMPDEDPEETAKNALRSLTPAQRKALLSYDYDADADTGAEED